MTGTREPTFSHCPSPRWKYIYVIEEKMLAARHMCVAHLRHDTGIDGSVSKFVTITILNYLEC